MNRRPLALRIVALLLFGTALPLIATAPAAQAQTPQVVINEFVAINSTGLVDNTGSFEDWIELRNTGSIAVDLGGWTLSDGGAPFTFASGVTIPAGGYRVVIASGVVARTTATEIHLPFKLSGSGESLVLSTPLGVTSEPSWAAPATYPAQVANRSYGLASGGQLAFFSDPTPGSANGSGAGGIVAPVSFSVAHGFYSSTQSVVLNTATPSATIRYTTNGSTPTATNGTPIAPGSTLDISATTTLRAVAYRSGWITSKVETRSYLFPSDIIRQSESAPAGWPSSPVNGQVFNYGMDPEIVNGNEALVISSLTSIPSISIVTDQANLTDPTLGIYVNPHDRGAERQASIELIDPTGAEPGFDIEGGIRMRGGFSRNVANPKHSFRLMFRAEYEGELQYPLFQHEGVDHFAMVDLRTSQNYSWSWRHTNTATFIEELWSRDTQRDMGQPYTRTRPYHVYLNGQYWGLYMTQERVSDDYGASYLGGAAENFDVIKRGAPDRTTEAGDGNLDALNSLWPLVSDQTITDTEYAVMADQIDLVNLADYYLLHFFSGDFDGSPSYYMTVNSIRYTSSNNFYAARDRTGVGPAGKWQFFDHDSEHSLCGISGPRLQENIDNTTPWNLAQAAGPEYLSPAWFHAALITHPAYRQIFMDRVQLHMLTPGGALTLEENLARFNARAAEFSPAIEGESARWGDAATASPYDRTDWVWGLDEKRRCFALRPAIVEAQLRADGLWPTIAAPTISPASGAVPYGSTATVAAGGTGVLWVTTDGSDPRATDGSPSATARQYTGPITVSSDVTIRVRRLDAGAWSPLVEGTYTLSTAAGPVRLALNEFNAVSSSNFLGGGTAGDIANGTDATFGRVVGNGGDWVEFVVIEDRLDLRGWKIEIWNEVAGVSTLDASLVLGQDAALSDLRAGSLVTISEDIADNLSYAPVRGDWHINLQSNDALAGAHITSGSQSNFAINHDNTQIAIFDATGAPVQLRTGEGTVAGVAVNNTEVFKLEGAPTTTLTSDSSLYKDGTSSTWGLPNVFGAGQTQDLSELRVVFGDANCDRTVNVADALLIAQYTVGVRVDSGGCPLASPSAQLRIDAADVNDDDQVTIVDALLVAQCTVGVTNVFCP